MYEAKSEIRAVLWSVFDKKDLNSPVILDILGTLMLHTLDNAVYVNNDTRTYVNYINLVAEKYQLTKPSIVAILASLIYSESKIYENRR